MTDNRGKLIVFEGDNLAGKTTLAHKLEAMLNESRTCAVYMKGAPSDSFFGGIAEKTGISSMYFLDYTSQEQLQIEPLLNAGISVILDRGFYSIASFSAAKHDIDVARLSSFPHLLPDILFYVTADREERRIRGHDRELSYVDKYLFENPDFEERIRENYERLFEIDNVGIARVDTTNQEIEEYLAVLSKMP